MAGQVDVDGTPAPVAVDGDVDWTHDPTSHPSTRLNLFAMKWYEGLVRDGLTQGREDFVFRAIDIGKDFVDDNLGPSGPVHPDVWGHHATAMRTSALLCLRAAAGPLDWLDDALRRHMRHLTEEYAGDWNHGTMQNLSLLIGGCQLGDAAASALAEQRLAEAFSVQVDHQGVTNEQAIGYQGYNSHLWEATDLAMRECGMTPPEAIADIRPKMLDALEHATRPDGFVVPLGDTHLMRPDLESPVLDYLTSGGSEGRPGTTDSAVFDAGYAFARSGWGTERALQQEQHLSMRFGPGRRIHGHNDHLSLTYFARGRDLVVDGGHGGYAPGPHRSYLQSPQAHNVVEVVGVKHRWADSTPLTRWTSGPDHHFFEAADAAYSGAHRARSVLMVEDPDFLVVYDRGDDVATRTWRGMWHLAPDLRVETVSRSYVRALTPDARSQLVVGQVPLPGEKVPPGSTRVVKGSTAPHQGWVSTTSGTQLATSTVTQQRSGRQLRMVTVIVPAAANQPVSWSTATRPDGWYDITVKIGLTVRTVRLSPGGYLAP